MKQIPRILHFIWLNFQHPGQDVPVPKPHWKRILEWKQRNPGWKILIWNDSRASRLIERYYPCFLPTYRRYDAPIYQADALRVMILHRYGGVYLDVDVECRGSLDSLFLFDHDLYLTMGRPRTLGLHRLTNWFLAARPYHPFWKHVLNEMQVRVESRIQRKRSFLGPLYCTGPILYDHIYKPNRDDAVVFESKQLEDVCYHRGDGSWIGCAEAAVDIIVYLGGPILLVTLVIVGLILMIK